MKITTEQLVALQQAQQKKKTQGKSQADFQKLLTEKTQQSGSASTSGVASSPGAASSEMYAKIKASMTRPTDQTSEQAVMDKMDNVLNRWENYAQLLGSTPPDLRQGYQLLESISNDIRELNEKLPASGGEADRIRPLLDELEILAVTERVKFNRGDYM